MEIVEYRPSRDQLVYTFGGAPPVMTVKPGTVLKLWSEDAFNHALTSVEDLSSEKVDLRFVNPQTGPFYVQGAEPGDTLVLHIVDLTPARTWGASATIPFFGGLTSTDRTALLQDPLPDTTWIYHVDSQRNTVGFESRFGDFQVQLPLEPMLGTVGVAPPGGEVRSSLVPERFGGNMDSPEVKAGSTIYLGVNVEGALFSIGDGHYRQGEGEACGTAVEGAMDSTIIVELIKGGAPAWPRIETDSHWMAVGSSRPMEDSWRIGQLEMVRWFVELFGLHAMDAYQLLTQTAQAPIANAVDANYSVVVKAAKSLFPTASAYDGVHTDLRNRSAGI
ncbi:acetamidase/formamidase family protein [Arthrobacter sp. EH-1B-1]|uniref:Acetamidase/formamidase family protein n=1 Tax=Arthrobacter vasquezii TaxID=2977629 RepID=A0ABT6D0B1_9MICC|nr:acetamidase/formamidase family protein [Arthrobacter vasquezii]MDF9279132.1 acetamidase/formamidase family protein [Arthrobacter vasquezii]